jgi:hypothetical protein
MRLTFGESSDSWAVPEFAARLLVTPKSYRSARTPSTLRKRSFQRVSFA